MSGGPGFVMLVFQHETARPIAVAICIFRQGLDKVRPLNLHKTHQILCRVMQGWFRQEDLVKAVKAVWEPEDGKP